MVERITERREHDPRIEEAADNAVRKVFAILGVDVDDPEKVEEFRADLRFGRSLRKAANAGVVAVIVTVAGAVVLALWYGFNIAIHKELL